MKAMEKAIRAAHIEKKIGDRTVSHTDQQVRENDKGKRNVKINADRLANAKEHTIKVGDTVLVRQRKTK